MDTFLKTTIRAAGDAILKKYGKINATRAKTSVVDVVTEADIIANTIIISAIKKKYPHHGIISEETGGYQENAEYVWIIDPLDGTRNFSRKSPLFGVMIGLARRGTMLMGGVYLPATQELLFAKHGKGAYMNNKRLRVTPPKIWNESWGVMSANIPNKKHIVQALFDTYRTVPCWISEFDCAAADLLYVASGRRDWMIAGCGGVWDLAASSIILKEAGYAVTNAQGKPWTLSDTVLFAGRKNITAKLVDVIRSAS